MSKEASEERDEEELWAEVEGFVGLEDFVSAEEVIDEAAEEGRDVSELRDYVDREKEKHD